MAVRRGVMESQGVPLARVDDLAVEELGDELLIYDLRSDHAHCLSAVAARVWRACDGRTSDAALASNLGIQADELQRALDELASCELLAASAAPGLSRRELTVRFATGAAAAAAAPLIVSIVAPTAAAQGTPVLGCEDVASGCSYNCGVSCQQAGTNPAQSACKCCPLNQIKCEPGVTTGRSSSVKACISSASPCPNPNDPVACLDTPCGNSTQLQQDLTKKQGATTTPETTTNTTPETTTTTTTTPTTTTTTPQTTTPQTTTTTESSGLTPPVGE